MSEQSGITRLLIATAIDPSVYRRFVESPEALFNEFSLPPEHRDLLRHPDHRLFPLLGATLAQTASASRAADAQVSPDDPAMPPASPPTPPATFPPPHTAIAGARLPDFSLALTLVPCAQYQGDQLTHFAFAAWVSPLPDGVDPATLPPPPGTSLPGRPLPPLHAVIRVAAAHMQDTAGNPLVGLTASLERATNISYPPPPDTVAPAPSPQAPHVQSAIAAVRAAPAGARYQKILDLLSALQAQESP